ncbi:MULTISPECIES: RNA polymerase subunit sigma-70 [unclassified Streptomyces]|uniref:RNA polymerase subunit sigma-70 n=1 Tax=unclassified Streptomyces TaxID=2593676 RepID=UPI0037FD63D3
MTSDPERITQLLAATRDTLTTELASISDPVAREASARQILAALPDITQEVTAIRSDTVRTLKEGRTLAEVGTLLGGLSTARVDQIIKAGKKK